MGKRVGTDIIQRVPVRQLGLPERGELVRRRQQFQFGGQRYLHAPIVAFFCVYNQAKGGRSFLPRLKAVGIRRARIVKYPTAKAGGFYEPVESWATCLSSEQNVECRVVVTI